MTHLENLTIQLQYGVKNFGENDSLVLELRQQIEDLKRRSPAEKSPTGPTEVLSFHVGFRKAKH
jgi:hypothetical protein